jgi:hypothetical protein
MLNSMTSELIQGFTDSQRVSIRVLANSLGFAQRWIHLLARAPGGQHADRRCAHRSSVPWQSSYIERLIGSIRQECSDHVVVLGKQSVRRTLRSIIEYYHGSTTHLALEKDAPVPRAAQLLEQGRVVAISEVGGLHHRYERRAA